MVAPRVDTFQKNIHGDHSGKVNLRGNVRRKMRKWETTFYWSGNLSDWTRCMTHRVRNTYRKEHCPPHNRTVTSQTAIGHGASLNILHEYKWSYDKPRQQIKKQRHLFANKGPSSQSCSFSRSHVQMYQKEGWAPKNCYFQIVMLEKTLKSPLNSKEIQPINAKGTQLWMFIGRIDAEGEAPTLWPHDAESRLIRKAWERQKATGEGRQRMRWSGSTTDSVDESLSKLWELVEDREGCAVRCRPRGGRVGHTLVTEHHQTSERKGGCAFLWCCPETVPTCRQPQMQYWFFSFLLNWFTNFLSEYFKIWYRERHPGFGAFFVNSHWLSDVGLLQAPVTIPNLKLWGWLKSLLAFFWRESLQLS